MNTLADLEPPIVQSRSAPAPAAPPPDEEPAAGPSGPASMPDPLLVSRLRRPEKRRPRRRRVAAPSLTALTARPLIIKVALGLVAGTVALALAAQVAAMAARPVLATYNTGREIRKLQGVLKQELRTNERLKQDITYLETRYGVEQEARRRGWVMPGEVALSIVPGGVAASMEAETNPPTAKPARVAVADRIRSAVDACLAVLGGKLQVGVRR